MAAQQFILHESASGFALFEVAEAEAVALGTAAGASSVVDLARFSGAVKLKGVHAFSSAENALANINDISEGVLSADLRAFLERSLPSARKSSKSGPAWSLGLSDAKLGSAIQEACGIPCHVSDTVAELQRGVRLHLEHYVPALKGGAGARAQLGLAHSYSRAKVKFNVNRSDNMIIQAIALIDTLDKDLNTFAMRVREWYGWHFPELARIVKDNFVYARVARAVGDRTALKEDSIPMLTELLAAGDDDAESTARAIYEAAKSSMGMDIREEDLANIDAFTARLVSLGVYRQHLTAYLAGKMHAVAPNLGALIGDTVAARLISHAGSLTNLAKAPASTIQILGAEKALFRALKTKGNTPKYGLIFHSSFIGRAAAKNKGRVSRYLANKCAIAARIDSFSDIATTRYGERLREQVEERLKFYESGDAPKKNADAMAEVMHELRAEGLLAAADGAFGGGAAGASAGAGSEAKKAKKEKKHKRTADDAGVGAAEDDEARRKAEKKARKAAAKAARSDDDE